MGRTRIGVLVLSAALLILGWGCKHDNALKPPKEEAAYRLPPDDPRYSEFPQFPPKELNKYPKRDPAAEDPMNKMPGKFGMGAPGG
ncbi:MAG TPA: hypothetical protein VKA46_28050 [Gemmataceae bacterium]|nr:hypothetical protein [Gemmataceae bacterium]